MRLVSRRAVLAGSAALVSTAARADAIGAVGVFGDSQAEGLLAGLRRVIRKSPDLGMTLQNHTKPGTSISQPTFDWPAAMAAYAAPGQAGGRAPVAVCLFGGNDRLPLRPLNAPTIPFRSAAWEAIYRERVVGMMTSLCTAGVRVTWLGQPVCREPRYNGDMAWLTALYQESAAAVTAAHPEAPAVRFLPLLTVVADKEGRFLAYGPGPEGKNERLRHDDGIHFSPAGYELVARHVVAALAA